MIPAEPRPLGRQPRAGLVRHHGGRLRGRVAAAGRLHRPRSEASRLRARARGLRDLEIRSFHPLLKLAVTMHGPTGPPRRQWSRSRSRERDRRDGMDRGRRHDDRDRGSHYEDRNCRRPDAARDRTPDRSQREVRDRRDGGGWGWRPRSGTSESRGSRHDRSQRRYDEPTRRPIEPQRRHDESWPRCDEPRRQHESSGHHSEPSHAQRDGTLYDSGSRKQKRKLPEAAASVAPTWRVGTPSSQALGRALPANKGTVELERMLCGRISKAGSTHELLRLSVTHSASLNHIHAASLWNKLGSRGTLPGRVTRRRCSCCCGAPLSCWSHVRREICRLLRMAWPSAGSWDSTSRLARCLQQ